MENGMFEKLDLDRVILKWNSNEAGIRESLGFYDHDKGDYKGTEKNFFEAYTHSLPWLDDDTLRKVAAEKTEVLKVHDEIEGDRKLSRKQMLESPLWPDVLRHATRQGKLLGLSDYDSKMYGMNKTEFYKKHHRHTQAGSFSDHVIDMEKYFSLGVIGKDVSEITGNMYLACVGAHDVRRNTKAKTHPRSTMSKMQEQYALYVNALHTNMPDYKNRVISHIVRRFL